MALWLSVSVVLCLTAAFSSGQAGDSALPSPWPVEFDTPGYAFGVAVVGSYAYVADHDDGLRVIDVSDPQNPFEAGYYDTRGWAGGTAVAGGYAYVADGYDCGLSIIEFYGAAVEERQGAEVRAPGVPTIVRGVMRMAGSQTATLTDISGRDVLRLTPGANDIRHLAPGVYFVRMKGRRGQVIEGSSTHKVLVTR